MASRSTVHAQAVHNPALSFLWRYTEPPQLHWLRISRRWLRRGCCCRGRKWRKVHPAGPPSCLETPLYAESQIDEGIEGIGDLTGKDLILELRVKALEETGDEGRLVPTTSGGQGAEFNREVRNRSSSLAQRR